MRPLFRYAPLASALAVLAAVAWAQPPAGGPPRGIPTALLLRQESVRKELKLSADQVKKLEELADKMGEKMQDAFSLEEPERGKKLRALNEETDKALAAILTPEQAKRLKQIVYQQQGDAALTTPEVAGALGLTEAQRKQIARFNEETAKLMREMSRPGGPPPDARARDRIEALRRAG